MGAGGPRGGQGAVPLDGLSPIGAAEVDAIAGLLRHPPVQGHSMARLVQVLELAAQAVTEPDLSTAALAERGAMSVGAIYRFFGDMDAVRVCVAALWMRRAVTVIEQAPATHMTPTPAGPAGLAGLLIDHLVAYRRRYRQPARTELAIRARSDREYAWHCRLTDALRSAMTASPGLSEQTANVQPADQLAGGPSDGRVSRPGLLQARCLVAVALADRVARVTAAAAVAGSSGPVADGLADLVEQHIRSIADAVLPGPTPAIRGGVPLSSDGRLADAAP